MGMAKGFFDDRRDARDVFERASECLGYDMAALCFEGPRDELDRTEKTQPAILTASVAALTALRGACDGEPAFVAGHSLGEYTALVASGALDFETALRLVRLRGRFMQECVADGVGRMSAVIGLDADTVSELCREASNDTTQVVAANLNSPEQVVVSGHAEAVERFAALASERGARRVIPLPVSVPSHSHLMSRAVERLTAELEGVEFRKPRVPVVSNVEAAAVSDEGPILELLARQLICPVRWVESVRFMARAGVTTTVEIGPGKVLSGLVRRIDRSLRTLNIDSPADLEGVVAALREA